MFRPVPAVLMLLSIPPTLAITGDAAMAESAATPSVASSPSRGEGSSGAPKMSGLHVAVAGRQIELGWTAPDSGSGLTSARLLRKLDADPGGPTDTAATLVYSGAAHTAADALTALLPSTTETARVYHYAVYGCDADSHCEASGSHATLAPSLVQVLKAGGYVLHWRHATADVCVDRIQLGTAAHTSTRDWWKSCNSDCATATARQLNPTGRTEAAGIGHAFTTLGIPVGRVRASEFCRTNQTATQMAFGPVIEQSRELTYFVYDETSRCRNTHAMLAEAPAPGTNTALIGHSNELCPSLPTLAWGEAAIYKPDGNGGATYIDRVTADAWLSLP